MQKMKATVYSTSDSLFANCYQGIFYVKGLYKASMKKEKRSVHVKLITTNGKVIDDSCSCKTGKSGYCNRVRVLLLEITDYSLRRIKYAPEEIACISRLLQWSTH